jgi:hypothetical protein
MGLGGTAKKIGKMLDIAEQTYKRLNEVREQLNTLRETVERTDERFDDVEREQRRQRALIEALADERGIDTDSVIASIEEDVEESDSETPMAADAPASDGNS